jgi:hypothetical protein
MGLEDYEVLEIEAQSTGMSVSDNRASVDAQVATAKQYPRSIKRSIDNSIAMATLDMDTAKSCGYALPRGGKPITGPSVHLAKIIASNWGNLRVGSKVVDITDKQVVSRGYCWDLETNVAAEFEVRRNITGRNGRFNDDMITVTGNASNAIALRNAIFSVIPKAIVDKVYKSAQEYITGDLSSDAKLIKRRTGAINFFNDEYGITEEEVVKLCGKQTVNQIRSDEIALLIGIQQSLKDGDTTVDLLMDPIRNSKEEKNNRLAKDAEEAAIAEYQKLNE